MVKIDDDKSEPLLATVMDPGLGEFTASAPLPTPDPTLIDTVPVPTDSPLVAQEVPQSNVMGA